MKEALNRALEALEASHLLIHGNETKGGLVYCMDGYYSGCFDIDSNEKQTNEAITALRLAIDVQNMASESTYKAALAQPAQEPTGMLHIDRLDKWLEASLKERKAQRTWVGLTEEEIQAVAKQARSKDHAVTLTNKLLKEKNT